ncbi:hypothetical protein HG537_0H03770 [Torulaspora globosa]|uniref:Uncharacterized protein n=1 Tax=Torulaspora globosa TaxID=48254 RepID=A0A7H9HXZ5_9SACH|nr:hypothetical protein HG537_0H03770 [Torulaspora sp. CBS 2947]
MPPKLPGLYFDEVKGRYFPVKAGIGSEYGENEQKKRKIRLQREGQARLLKDQRWRNYEKLVSRLVGPVEKIFDSSDGLSFAKGLEIEARSVDNCVKSSLGCGIFNLGVQLQTMKGPVICEQVWPNGVTLAIWVDEGGIGAVQQPFDRTCMISWLHRVRPSECPRNTSCNIIRFAGNRFERMGLYCHMALPTATEHIFTVFTKFNGMSDYQIRKLELHGNVYDSVNLGSTFVVAVGSSLQIYDWNELPEDGYKVFNSIRNKSDILCLAVNSGNSGLLYAGTRSGWIYELPVQTIEGGTPCHTTVRNFRVRGVRSIVSIKTTDTKGLIFVSAISGDSQQILLLLDPMLEPEDPTLVTFRTSFSNMTKDQEFFEVTSDGRFLLYGSTAAANGHGDFEVFSSHLGDNLAHERNGRSFTFFPLNSLRNGYLEDSEYSALRDLELRSATFINYKRDSYDLKCQRETNQPYKTACPNSWRISAFFKSEFREGYHSSITMLLKRVV